MARRGEVSQTRHKTKQKKPSFLFGELLCFFNRVKLTEKRRRRPVRWEKISCGLQPVLPDGIVSNQKSKFG
jgi:hypothetical protein